VPQATTVLTRTIGSGKDYASFTLAEADVENIGASADLVFENEQIVFEADAGTYASIQVNSTLVTDVTRNVTYKAAAGSDHGGDVGSGARLIFDSAGNGGIWCLDDYTRFIGLVVTTGSGAVGNRGLLQFSASYLFVDACLLEVAHSNPWCIWANGASTANTYQNNLLRNPNYYTIRLDATTSPTSHKFVSNTIDGNGNRAIFYQVLGSNMTVEAVNNFIFNVNNWATGNSSGGATFTTTGSNNVIDVVGSNMGAGVAILECTASQSADPGAGDYALYVGKNGALLDSPNNDAIGQGVGPAANSDVPIVDILGNARSGSTANPGAFEIPQATLIRTRTIGPVGRDYATFTLAEADVTNITTSTDLVNENEAIVFEADAGTYGEGVFFSSTLTTDATRNVTYRPAVGSEHGGDKASGVRIVSGGTVLTVQDEHTVFDGLVAITTGGAYLSVQQADGVIFRNLLMQGNGTCVLSWQNGATTPMLVENCVGYSDAQNVFYAFASTAEAHVKYRNCTSLAGGTARGWTAFGSATYHLYVDILNCIAIGTAPANNTYGQNTDVTVTGSNNFGTSGSPFPVALQGSPYPVTATTDTDPGPGDWAIYDATNGALIDDPDNDVIGGGVGPFVNSDVPETDILGNTRSGSTTEPGAFVISSSVAPLPPVDQWTQVMVRSDEPVDVYGVLTFGDAYINAVETTLSATGTGISANTAAIPVGTRAIWVQLISQTGPSAGETADIAIEISATQSLTMATVGSGVGTGYVPGLYQFPVQCLSLDDAEAYPRVKMTNGATVGATDIVKVRVIAIGGLHTDTAWT
jgi:hypothetical protein